MPRAHATNNASILFEGLHQALLLVNQLGREALAAAHDPIPLAAHGTHRPSRLRRGDPFDEPARPLVLTLASDCASLARQTQHDLLSLGRYPGVVVELMPGLDPLGFREPAGVSWTDEDARLRIRVGSGADAGSDELFARFDGPAATQFERRDRETWASVEPGLVAGAARMFDTDPETAGRLAIEAIVHEALGNDYIVSPILTTARHDRAMAWPNQIGACSVAEAFRLAGAKARMYRTVPLLATPTGLGSVNVGQLYDLAVTHFTPCLMRALSGALSPLAPPGEAAAADHLLSIRGRLQEILIARDAIYRLTRRAALGPAWVRAFDSGPTSGSAGNDLTVNLAYHLAAALNSAFAATDNLAWVLARRDDPGLRGRWVGLGTLLGPRRRPWASGADAERGARALLGAPDLPFVLAAREVRNIFMHSEGVDYGAVDWHPPTDAPLQGLAAVWVFRDALPVIRLREGTADLFQAIAEESEWADAEFALLTFQTFADRLWSGVSAIVGICLQALDWSPSDWTRKHPHTPISRRWWRTRLQRRLWGLRT